MAAALYPVAKSQFFDNNGNPLSLGTVEITYTTTANPAPTYTDSIKSAQNEAIIHLSAAGKADIYLDPGSYNIVTKDADGVMVDTTYNYIVEAQASGTPGAGNVPIGGIIMYNGLLADIPTDWQLCNGTNGTPDLTGKFIRGTILQSEIGDEGGSDDAVVVEHTHTINHIHKDDGKHLHEIYYATNGAQGSAQETIEPAGNGSLSTFMDEGGEHKHDYTGDSGSAGVTGNKANLPTYYTLAYIQRIA